MPFRRILAGAALAIAAFGLPVRSQTVQVSGTVKNPEGQVLAGASVRLLASGLSGTTGADGRFLLQGASAVRGRPRAQRAALFPDLDQGRLVFRADGRAVPVSGTTARHRALPAAKSSAFLDTLEVRLAGHIRGTLAVPTPTAEVPVTLRRQWIDPELAYPPYSPSASEARFSRSEYLERMHGFWLGECIGNWTGLVTEMDKIGPPFYTGADWGKRDQRNIWGNYGPHPDTLIDYVLVARGTPWGADDDTDLEYLYQHLLDVNNASVLTGAQIRDGWIKHIKAQEENYLWVSNQRAFDLMRAGTLPPETSLPANNPHYDMIDAQLTTELFGLLAPGRPDIAARMALLPVRTTAYGPAEAISQFYVRMHALAPVAPDSLSLKEKVRWLARQARAALPDTGYPARMFDFVVARHAVGTLTWEAVRDELHQRYQVNRADGYDVPARPGVECRGCFAAGINFAASVVSLFYGEGDLLKTIRIGSLMGWDSDNPTATWAGLLGFLLGRQGVEAAFGRTDLSEAFWIHRTRQAFPDRTPAEAGEDTFPMMAERAVRIIDRVVLEEMKGGVDPERDVWYVPAR